MPRRTFFSTRTPDVLFRIADLEDRRILFREGVLGKSLLITEKIRSSPAEARALLNEWIQTAIQDGFQENPDPVFTPPFYDPASAGPAPETEPAPPQSGNTPAAASRNPDSTDVPVPLERSIRLTSDHWDTIPWMMPIRPLDSPPVPDVVPFDREDCLDRLTKSLGEISPLQHHWHFPPVSPNPSRLEAHFWLKVMELLGSLPWRKVPAAAGKMKIPEVLTIQDLKAILKRSHHLRPPGHFLCLATAFPSREDFLTAIMEDEFEKIEKSNLWLCPISEFQKEILPVLTPEELRSVRAFVSQYLISRLPAIELPREWFNLWPSAVRLGCVLQCGEVMDVLIRRLPDQFYARDHFENNAAARPGARELRDSLPFRSRILEETRRLPVYSMCAGHSTLWLALTGWHGLDVIADSAARASKKTQATAVAEPLLEVAAPEAATAALRLILETKAGHIGVQWLNAHPLHAVAGLTPTAMGQGKLAEAAREHLHNLRRSGKQNLLQQALPHLTAEQADFLRRQVLEAREESLPELQPRDTPPALAEALKSAKPAPSPDWITLAALPPILLAGAKLGEDALRRLITELKKSPAGVPGPICQALRRSADPASLETFVWHLFEAWLQTGAETKEKWAFTAAGHLGGDRTALKLTPLLREWPTLGQQKRAAMGLELLRAIGTDTALTQLHGISLKVKSAPLKKAAHALMARIAEDRGLSPEDLEDRITPPGGLDPDGTCVLDFGPRQFTAFLKSDLKPALRDPDGRPRPDLPAPNAADDPDKAAAALETWRLLRKNIASIARTRTARLEQALVTGRRWALADFLSCVTAHPILSQIARKLVWAAFDEKGGLSATFRVAEDRSLADLEDHPWTPPEGCRIGLAHPLLLDPDTLSAWTAVLQDYKLVPPFPQLQRPVYALPPGTAATGILIPGNNQPVPIRSLLSFFEKHQWTCLRPPHSHVACHHAKSFGKFPDGQAITAVIRHDPGVWDRGDIESMGDQTPGPLFFVSGPPDPADPDNSPHLPLGQIDPIALSEARLEFETLLAKAR